MKKFLLMSVIALGVPLCLTAIEIDGINYTLNGSSRTCSVASSTVSGDIAIPSTIDASGTTYTVATIEAGAFSDCRELTGIEIPASVASVGNQAFDNCTALTSIVISDGDTALSLGYNYSGYYRRGQFYDCPIESLYIGRNLSYSPVSSYDYSPFYGRNNITSITIGEKVTEIGRDLFRGFSELDAISLPSGVQSIGAGAFRGCSNLTGLTLPSALVSIGVSAFYGCVSLAAMDIPVGVKQIGNSAFYGCSQLESVSLPAALETIGGEVFYNCSILKSVVIPDGVSSLGNGLFQGCSSLESVSLPENLTTISEYAFNGCSSLTSIEIPSRISSIGNYAFTGCTALKSVIFADGEGVVKLGYDSPSRGLFYDCPIELLHVGRSLTYDSGSGYSPFYGHEPSTLTIGDNVTAIGDNFFRGFTGMTAIELPDSLTKIGSGAFYGCSALVEIEIPGNVASIGNNAFNGCGVLKKVIFADGDTPVQVGYNSASKKGLFYDSPISELHIGRTLSYSGGSSYGYSPLYGRDKIEQLTIGDKVTDVGDYLFYGLSTLTSIDLPDGLKTIGQSAFESCNLLTAIEFPDSLQSRGASAFKGCDKLETLIFPAKLTNISNDAFSGCSAVKNITFADGAGMLQLGYNSASNKGLFSDCPIETLHIGRRLSYSYGSSYGYSPFYGREPSKSLTIGENVTTIAPYLFANFKKLSSIKLADNLTAIENGAFSGCSALASVEIPSSVTSVGNYAFDGCTGLKSLVIADGEGTLSLGYNTYTSSSGSTGKGLFYDCPLDTVHVGRNLSYDNQQRYGYSPLYGQAEVTAVTVGDKVTSIGANLFGGMTALASMEIPSSVTSVGNYVFNGCTGLKSLVIADGEGTLSLGYNTYTSSSYSTGKGLFYDCPLDTVHVGRNLSYDNQQRYGYSPLYGQAEVTAVTVGEKVTSIGENLFRGMTALASMEIPASVTSIGESAFSGCAALTSMEIPASVTSVGNYAFDGCTGLKSLVIADGKETLKLGYNTYSSSSGSTGKGLFYDCPLETVHVGRNLKYDTGIYYGYSPLYGQAKITILTVGNKVAKIGDHLFRDMTSLASVVLPDSLETIGTYAFQDCVALASIEIPSSVTSVGNYAFNGCTGLKSLEIADGDKELQLGYNGSSEGLFYDCPLETVYVGRNLSYNSGYGYSPLCGQLKVVTLTVGDKVTEIGENLFRDMTALASIEIPASVTSVGNYAFNGCTGVKSLMIADGDKTLQLGYNTSSRGLFYDCPLETAYVGRNLSYNSGYGYSPLCGQIKVVTLTVGNKVTEIGENLFRNMMALASIKMPASVKTLGSGAFSGCSGLAEVALESGDGWNKVDKAFDETHFASTLVTGATPEATLKIGDSDAWASFRKVEYNADEKHYVPVYWNMPLAVVNSILTNEEGCLVNRDETAVVSAKESGGYVVMFRGEDVSERVASDCGFAFDPNEGRNLNRFTVYGNTGDKVRIVALKKAGELFNTLGLQNIQSIETLILSGDINGTDVMTINRMPLLRNLDLRNANIVEGGETYRDDLKTADNVVGKSFFYGTGNLENVMLPLSATSIANEAFYGNDSLVNVLIGENVGNIGRNAFSGCTKLTAINIPASVTNIGYTPFEGCKSLVSVRFEEGKTPLAIGLDYYSNYKPMFADSRIEAAYIGRDIAGSYDYAYGNDGYRQYYSSYNKAPLYNQSSLRTAEFGDSVSYIGHEFFYGCKNLEKISVPDSIKKIEYLTFSGCSSLKTVRLGKGLQEIAYDAFSGCTAIDEIRSLNPLPPVITSQVFADVDKEQCKLVVTKGNLVHYWLDPVWKEFMNMTDDILDLSPLPAAKYGDAPVDLASYAPEGVTLSYESSNPEVARIDGTMLTICGAGEATIGAINPDQGAAMELIGQMRQFKVSKADLEVTAPDVEILVGEALPEFELTYRGFCYNDTFECLDEAPVAICEATSTSEPGEYAIELSGGADRNYNLTLVPGVLRIKEVQSGVDNAKRSRFDCLTTDGAIVLSGLREWDEVCVYSLDGSICFQEVAKEHEITIPVAGRSFYLVKVGETVVKVFVK